MTLSRKDHFIIAATALVKPPIEYVGKQETEELDPTYSGYASVQFWRTYGNPRVIF